MTVVWEVCAVLGAVWACVLLSLGVLALVWGVRGRRVTIPVAEWAEVRDLAAYRASRGGAA